MLTLMIHTSPRKSTPVALSSPRHSIQFEEQKNYCSPTLPSKGHHQHAVDMDSNTRRGGHVLRESSEGANQQERQKEGGRCNKDSLRRVVCECLENPFA